MRAYNEAHLSAVAAAIKGSPPEQWLSIYHQAREMMLLRNLRDASDFESFIKAQAALKENDKLMELSREIEKNRLNPETP